MKAILWPCAFLLGIAMPVPAQVSLAQKSDRITINVDGTTFTNLYFGRDARKPFLYPLTTASGKKVSRGFPVQPDPGDPTDNPHQRGLWVGMEKLDIAGTGLVDFWENDPSYKRPHMGDIVFDKVMSMKEGEEQGSLTFGADWRTPDGKPVVRETRTLTFYAKLADCRMFDVDLRLEALADVTFEDHDDGVIGMRFTPGLNAANGGRPVNAQGLAGEANTRGKRSEWIDWQGTLEGEPIGIALMDHPSNFAYPTRWHIRSMGLVIANPFGQHEYNPEAPVAANTLHRGNALRLRYRVLIHPQSADLRRVFESFAQN